MCIFVYIIMKDMFTDTDGNALHGWIITFNTHKMVWTAVPRDKYFDLFNSCDCNKPYILCSPSISHLQDMIINYK